MSTRITPLQKLLGPILLRFGVTRAVSWTLMTQAVRLLTGPLNMFLMVRFLDEQTQGYAYTFGSVLSLSIMLEMGFSQNILQFASHEYARLSFNSDKSLSGDATSLSRLVSLGRLAFKYYGVATIAFLLVLLFGGTWFFQSNGDHGVDWFGPWMMICVSGSLSLLLNPFWAILEGCDRVAEVEKFRFYSSVTGFLVLAVGLICGLKLYSASLSSIATLIASVFYILIFWKGTFRMFLKKPADAIISWRKEIWPFQWRIALSWMSGYFIFSLVTPAVFRIVGPGAAGRIGFTLQLARMIATVASSWSTTRLPEFGILVARREWEKLQQAWKKSAIMSVAVTILGSLCMIATMQLICEFFPHVANRYGGWQVATLFCLSMAMQSLINSFAFYLRAFKEEPFMVISLLNALVSFVLVISMTLWWKEFGAALGYTLAIGVILPLAYRIFAVKSRIFRLRATPDADAESF